MNDAAVVESASIDAGPFRTHYLRAGDRSNRSVVLLHDGAWGADASSSWRTVIEDLARKYDVIAPDMLGFGRTDKVVFLDRAPFAGRILHLRLFAEALGIDASAHWAGTSFGGSVLLRAAAANAWAMASASSIGGTGGPWRRADGMALLSRFEPGAEYMTRVVEMLTNQATGFESQVGERIANLLEPGAFAAMSAPAIAHPDQHAGVPEKSYPADLRAVVCPVVVIEMSDDRVSERGWADRIAAIAPNVRVRHLDGPHSPNLTDPVALGVLLRSIFRMAEHEWKANS